MTQRITLTDAEHCVIIDADSGTITCLERSYIVDTRLLSAEEIERLDNGSDGDRIDIALDHGELVLDVVDLVQALKQRLAINPEASPSGTSSL